MELRRLSSPHPLLTARQTKNIMVVAEDSRARREVVEETMKSFEFHAELFDLRNAVVEAMSDNGFMWRKRRCLPDRT